MQAVRFHEVGGPEVLTLEDVPIPEPGAGEVRIRVETIGVNFIDCYRRSGLYPVPLPSTAGQEVAGVVSAVGSGVSDVRPGDRVVTAAAKGGYADEVIATADQVAPVPDGVSFELAGAVFLQGLTAHYLAVDTFPLQPGHRALVYAAAGGVGRLLVQIARQRGAFVIGVVGHPSKVDAVRRAGANEVIVRSEASVPAIVRCCAPEGVDVVYDSVGRATFEDSLASLRPRGLLVSYGNASGAVPAFEPLKLSQGGSLFLTRPMLIHYTRTPAELRQRATDIFRWIAAGELEVVVSARYSLRQAAVAHRALESGQTSGKLILRPGSE